MGDKGSPNPIRYLDKEEDLAIGSLVIANRSLLLPWPPTTMLGTLLLLDTLGHLPSSAWPHFNRQVNLSDYSPRNTLTAIRVYVAEDHVPETFK